MSDWMAIEKERGISVTTSVMKFHYDAFEINLLDTPGHQDFSEDTYRVLTAVDSALMVIDSGKGVEPQTEKLMEVCRMRNTPIMTFINKLDRDGMAPMEILANIEDKLQIECAPLSWPIGMGKEFKGVYNLYRKSLHLFTPGKDSRKEKGITITDLDDPKLDELLGSQAEQLREEIALIEGAASPFSHEEYLKGNQTPVFFGSAINNFGVRELLDAFVEMAPAPGPRPTTTRMVSPLEEPFSGFVFKIQANMDLAHRDRIAFFRICSGKFTRGMKVFHHRIGREIVLSNATIFMAQDRTNVEEAWPGDIIGIHNHGTIQIGDTFTEGETAAVHRDPELRPGALPAGPGQELAQDQAAPEGADPALRGGGGPGLPAALRQRLHFGRGRRPPVRRDDGPPEDRIRRGRLLRADRIRRGPLDRLRRPEAPRRIREAVPGEPRPGRRRPPDLPRRERVAPRLHHGGVARHRIPQDPGAPLITKNRGRFLTMCYMITL